jgi:hypothetical protein
MSTTTEQNTTTSNNEEAIRLAVEVVCLMRRFGYTVKDATVLEVIELCEKAAGDPRRCEHCQGRMQGLAIHAKYCSKSCKVMACRTRNAKPKAPNLPKPPKAERNPDCFNCGQQLHGKQRSWCSNACQKQHERAYT